MKRSSLGFTLIELLISLALVGILLTAVVYLNIGTSKSAAVLQARNDLMPEMQIAQNYMANKLREATYVFPDNAQNIQMSAEGITSTKPSGGTNWVTGSADQIVAFIIPPRTVLAGQCASEGAKVPEGDVAEYCYAFYAFYAMKRSDLVNPPNGVTGADNPGANPANDSDSWVLMEYRSYYSSTTTTNRGYLANSSQIPTGRKGRLLMDYLPSQYTATNRLFTVAGGALSKIGEVPGITTVTIKLAAQQLVAGQMLRLPSSDTTKFSSITVYPRNVGKPELDN